jgi:8-oxo-dGTP diphosphatase
MKRIRATAIVVRENKLLMIHRLKNGEEYFVLPGGTVEEGETAETAALRELKEETSLDGVLKKKVSSFNDDNEVSHELFSIECNDGEIHLAADSIEAQIMNDNDKYEPVWVSFSQIKDLKIYPGKTKEVLLKFLKL